MHKYKNNKWLYRLSNGKPGLFFSLIISVLFSILTLELYKLNNAAFIFLAFIDFLVIIVMLIALYRVLVFKVLISKNEIYYQTRLGGGHTYSFSNIRQVWISSGRGENYCTFKLTNGTVIKFPFYTNDYQAIVFFKNQIEVRNIIFDEKIDFDYYRITGKNYGKSYIIGAIVILFVVLVFEFFVRKLYLVQGILIFRYVEIIACVFVIAFLFVRYKYLDIKIDREGFSFQTGPFNKKYYQYTDIVSCNEITKRITTNKNKAVGTTFYRDYFLFTDKNGITRQFQYEKHLYNYEIYILKKRINDANGIKTDNYREDESMIQEELNVEDFLDNKKAYASKHISKVRVFKVIIVVLFLILVLNVLWPMITEIKKVPPTSEMVEKLMDHLEVRELLEQRGFDTVDMSTSYWFFDENKLMYVASGKKETSKIEFYEYRDDKTTDGVYNRISYDFNQNLESKDRAKYERKLKHGGKVFEMTISGTYKVVAFKDNTVVYGSGLEQDCNEILKIVEEMGYK